MRKLTLPLFVAIVGCSGDPASQTGPDPAATGAGGGLGGPGGVGAGGTEVTDPSDPKIVKPPPEGVSARFPLAARLTKAQLRNTILDLLGVTIDDAALNEIPNDLIKETGFVTGVASQPLEPKHLLGFASVAESVASQVDATALAQALAQCADATAACSTELVSRLGLKLFRRPLLTEESQRFQTLFTTLAAIEGAAFGHVFRGLLSAMLQSPQFLYKLEMETLGTPGTDRTTTGHELASRLSYFIWQSAPDDGLLTFAAKLDNSKGGIDPAELRTQVDRMMADTPRMSRARDTFWADYTHASSASFQDATPELAAELKQSVVGAFNRISGDGAPEVPLQSLFTTTKMVMTPGVAELLNLPPAGAGLQEYDTADLPQRVGLLTHPGFLASIGSVSFVGRGLILSQRVMCREIPDPPESIGDEIAAAQTETLNLTPKGASEYRFGLGGPCLACHKAFEPVSYAFERFDVLGAYTEKDAAGRDLFSAGYLQGASGESLGDYQDAVGLMTLLAASEETSKCFVQNMMEFATGRHRAGADQSAIDAAHSAFKQEGGTFSPLVRSIALAPTLRALKVANPAQ